MKWIAMFSHTGAEIAGLSKSIGLKPDKIICNQDKSSTQVPQQVPITHVQRKPDVDTYHELLSTDAIITMHGWMRIVPGEICNQYNIYNLHPGLITKYPELKGKDPQQRAFNMNMSEIGCVLHRAIAQVDSGGIVDARSINNRYKNVDDLTQALKRLAHDMWVSFFAHRLQQYD